MGKFALLLPGLFFVRERFPVSAGPSVAVPHHAALADSQLRDDSLITSVHCSSGVDETELTLLNIEDGEIRFSALIQIAQMAGILI